MAHKTALYKRQTRTLQRRLFSSRENPGADLSCEVFNRLEKTRLSIYIPFEKIGPRIIEQLQNASEKSHSLMNSTVRQRDYKSGCFSKATIIMFPKLEINIKQPVHHRSTSLLNTISNVLTTIQAQSVNQNNLGSEQTTTEKLVDFIDEIFNNSN